MGQDYSRVPTEPVTGVKCGYYMTNYDGHGYPDPVLTGDTVLCGGVFCVVVEICANKECVNVARIAKGDRDVQLLQKLVPVVSCRHSGVPMSDYLAAIPPLLAQCETVRTDTLRVEQTIRADYSLNRQQKNVRTLPDTWLRMEILQTIQDLAVAQLIKRISFVDLFKDVTFRETEGDAPALGIN